MDGYVLIDLSRIDEWSNSRGHQHYFASLPPKFTKLKY